jgi:acetyl esterase/lipase
MMHKATATPLSFLDEQLKRGISHREVKVRNQDGSNHEIILSIIQSAKEAAKLRPCIYWIHGGGFHWGDRLHTLELVTSIILECDAMCISVEYRLAPEYSFSIAVEDCYAGLRWTGEHAAELGIDQRKLMVGECQQEGDLLLRLCSRAVIVKDRRCAHSV